MSTEYQIFECCVTICFSVVVIVAMWTKTPLEIFFGIFIPRNVVKNFFSTTADKTVWPIFHYTCFDVLLLVNFFLYLLTVSGTKEWLFCCRYRFWIFINAVTNKMFWRLNVCIFCIRITWEGKYSITNFKLN